MTKKAKTFRMTASRKAFLNAVAKLGKYFDDDGTFKEDAFYVDDLADSLIQLFEKLPKSLRSINAAAELFGSALYVLQMHADFREVDTCSEACKGSAPFTGAFFAGWSLGFDAGKQDAQDEQIGKAT